MSMGKRLARNRKRNLTCSDRPDPHRLVLSIFREAQLSATAFLSRSRSLASFKKTLFKPVFGSATDCVGGPIQAVYGSTPLQNMLTQFAVSQLTVLK
jgi:hypothetical protein